MQREPITSSHVVSVGYDPASSTLEVEFDNGGVYQYHDVPAEVHEQVMGAISVGGFIARNVRNNYDYTKVS